MPLVDGKYQNGERGGGSAVVPSSWHGGLGRLCLDRPWDEDSLQVFFSVWLEESIVPVELPAVRWAYECASRNNAAGLVALDNALDSLPWLPELRRASAESGRRRLRSLLPLKGHRCVGRYAGAVAAGKAAGHHPVVFGLYLCLFSLPLRQGLLAYACRTVEAFAGAAAVSLRLPTDRVRSLVGIVCADLPQRVELSLRVSREQVFPSLAAAPSPATAGGGAAADRSS